MSRNIHMDSIALDGTATYADLVSSHLTGDWTLLNTSATETVTLSLDGGETTFVMSPGAELNLYRVDLQPVKAIASDAGVVISICGQFGDVWGYR
jgi:hypothetical protein